MQSKLKLISIFIVILIIALLFWGLLINSMTVGIYEDIRFNSDEQITLPLDSNDISHKENYSNANYSISISFDNRPKFISYYYLEISTLNDTLLHLEKIRSNYSVIQFYKCPINNWNSFSIKFNINSSDPYIRNKSFFGDSNIINGKIKINQIENIIMTRYTGYEIKLNRNYSDVELNKMDSYAIEFITLKTISLIVTFHLDVLLS